MANYKDGLRDGPTTWYSENGQKKMTIEYKNGQFEGRQESFYPDGSLKSEATYKNVKLQGKVKTYEPKPETNQNPKKETEGKDRKK